MPTDDRAEALLDAVTSRDAGGIGRLLAAGADPRSYDGEGVPLLLHAADTGDVALVRPFLDAGAPVDLADPYGVTPLMCAVMAGAPAAELVDLLVARGADVNSHDDVDEHTVLTRALETPAEPMIAALLAAGADPNLARGDGWTPLMLAAQDAPPATVRLLLDAGADPAAIKDGEVTAMSVAEHWGRAAVVELLRAHGADDPLDRVVARVGALWDEIGAWFAVHASPCAEQLRAGTGASPAAVQALAVEVGHHLPVDLRAHLQLYGGNGGGTFFEYAGLSVDAALVRWRDLTELRRQGTFDGWAPCELATDQELVEPVWWSPAWLPFAEDGGGNLYCVDLAPARRGVRGQVIAWEVHGGPVGPMADSFEAYLSRYRDELRSGRYRYDLASGTFDAADCPNGAP